MGLAKSNCVRARAKIDHVYLHPLLLEGKVSHIPTGILQKEIIISYMGGGFAYLVFSTMLMIFYKDGDRRYLSVYLTFMISHLITAFFESARHSWYLNNAGPVTMWGTVIGLLVSTIVYFRQDLKTILTSKGVSKRGHIITLKKKG